MVYEASSGYEGRSRRRGVSGTKKVRGHKMRRMLRSMVGLY